jgi:hypothetical protein
VQRLAARACDAGYDAVVAMSLENATYTAGFAVPSQALGNRSRLLMAIVAANGQSRQIVADMEESLARAESALDRVLAYNEFTLHPVDLLSETLAELVGKAATIGLELDLISQESYSRLCERPPSMRSRAARQRFGAGVIAATQSATAVPG